MGALLTIDRAVIQAMASAESKSACAGRLAARLPRTILRPPPRTYICLQLRQIGTPAEVSALSRMLADEETAEMARCALEAIPGEESAVTLREALSTVQGKSLIGIINSVAARKDVQAVNALQRLADLTTTRWLLRPCGR